MLIQLAILRFGQIVLLYVAHEWEKAEFPIIFALEIVRDQIFIFFYKKFIFKSISNKISNSIIGLSQQNKVM